MTTSSVASTRDLSHTNLNVVARTAIQILFLNDSRMPPSKKLDKEMRHADLLRGIKQHRHRCLRFYEEINGLPHCIEQRDTERGALRWPAKAHCNSFLWRHAFKHGLGPASGAKNLRWSGAEEAYCRQCDVEYDVEQYHKDYALRGKGLEGSCCEARGKCSPKIRYAGLEEQRKTKWPRSSHRKLILTKSAITSRK
jgi:hypothetical protein